MSRLLLVRHGQARAFEEDSDRLTDRGEEQSRRFGEWLARQGTRINEVRCGSLLRHRQTADQIGLAFPGLPTAVIDERWNEFDSTGVMAHVATQLALRDTRFAELLEASRAYRKTPEANRYFQRMFEVLMTRWTNGNIGSDQVESWAAFQSRVRAGLKEITEAAGDSRTVLVVASGGSIATAVQTVLRAADATALELNWRMRNTSLTEMLFSRGRVSLDLFNAVPHLTADEATYR
ncbi:MAG: histidine phosphatase family protein [Acidobacteria bacterium]|nr:histidine phosphatase family protein [Acidobacteriota bacterium]